MTAAHLLALGLLALAGTALAERSAVGGSQVAKHSASSTDSVLLLGLHVEAIEGYGPMFSDEGKPRTNLGPGYRTLVIRIDGGGARVAAELPYLAVPRARGFLYLGEASVSQTLKDPPDVDAEGPRFYDATQIWRTTSRSRIPVVQRDLERRLRRGAQAGHEDTTQIAYVTAKLLCTSRTVSEWTGGALAFTAQQSMQVSTPAGRPLGLRLARYANRQQLEQFMHAALKEYDDGDQPKRLDEPFDAGFDHVIDFRKDPGVCLEHHDGRLWLGGTVLLPGNSARSFTAYAPVVPAPKELGGLPEPGSLAEAKRLFPAALDVVSTLSPDVWLVFERAALVAVNAKTRRELLRLPLAGRIVMAEGARGAAVARWVEELAEPSR